MDSKNECCMCLNDEAKEYIIDGESNLLCINCANEYNVETEEQREIETKKFYKNYVEMRCEKKNISEKTKTMIVGLLCSNKEEIKKNISEECRYCGENFEPSGECYMCDIVGDRPEYY